MSCRSRGPRCGSTICYTPTALHIRYNRRVQYSCTGYNTAGTITGSAALGRLCRSELLGRWQPDLQLVLVLDGRRQPSRCAPAIDYLLSGAQPQWAGEPRFARAGAAHVKEQFDDGPFSPLIMPASHALRTVGWTWPRKHHRQSSAPPCTSKSSTDCRCRTRGALRGVLGHAELDGAAALDPGRREVADHQWEFAWSEFPASFGTCFGWVGRREKLDSVLTESF